jgi:hypothetical protein
MNGRRVLLHPNYIQAMRNTFMREARADLHQMHFEHLCQLADLRRELTELREVLELVVSVSRQKAETDVATLRQQLETALAKLERPSGPLN